MLGLGGAAAVAAPVVAKAVEPPVPKTIGISPPTRVPGSTVNGWDEVVETVWLKQPTAEAKRFTAWFSGYLADAEAGPPKYKARKFGIKVWRDDD